MNELVGLEKYLNSISDKNVDFKIMRMYNQNGCTLSLVSRVEISDYNFMKDGHKSIINKLEELRNILLSNDLFYVERKQLAEYEKLKNMQFVLEYLRELDLSSIKEIKPENIYFNATKALGGK